MIYDDAEVILDGAGTEVGEVYQEDDAWGCFHYDADYGADGMDSREDALACLVALHSRRSNAELIKL